MQPHSLRDLRRGQIVAVARTIVAEEGLDALTIAALESRLDFTRGVITYHFKNKDDIVEAVLDSAIAEIDAAMLAEVQTARSLEERVAAVLRGQVRGWIDHPEAGRIVLSFWGRLWSDKRLGKKNAALYARYRAESAMLVAGTGVDVEAISALLVGTVIGLACQAYFEPKAIPVDRALEEAVVLFLDRLRGKRSRRA